MADDTPEPLEGFANWLLHRVAQAVEAGEVPADLLTELRAEIEAAGGTPQEEGEVAAVRQIAEIVGISEERVAKVLSSIETEPAVVRQRLLRRIAEAWLEGHQEAYRRGRAPRWSDGRE